MNETRQENQQEFFPDFAAAGDNRKADARPAASLPQKTQKPILFTTTLEQILFGAILSILVLGGVFFLGILRGKALALEDRTPAGPTTRLITVQASPIASPVRVKPAAETRPPASAPMVPQPTQGAAPAATAPAAKPVPPVSQAGRKLYTIQIVTHKKRSTAENELAAIGKAGFSGRVTESEGYYVVSVGQYAAKEDAKKDLSFLKTRYADCFLRRLLN